MTPRWTLRLPPRAVGRRGRAETIDIGPTGRIRARVRKRANTDLLKMTSLRMIMMVAEALVADPIVQKAQKVRKKNKITWLLLVIYRGVAVGATGACELFFLFPTKCAKQYFSILEKDPECVEYKSEERGNSQKWCLLKVRNK